MKVFKLIILLIQLTFFAKAQYQTKTNDLRADYFLNPIFAGDYPDPSIIRDGDNYYIVHSSFEYYPGLLIWQSKDLINWTPVTNALYKYVGSVWAPDLVKYKNKYYIYFPANNNIYVVAADSINGPWSDPVTFTNSQYPHITSYGHELALSIVFESGLQHMADRPEGYSGLPDAAEIFLREVPNAWDNTKLIDGYPGKDIIIARLKGSTWYLGGINGESKEKTKTVSFDFLPEGKKYKLTLIKDGEHDKDFIIQYMVVDKSSTIEVKMLHQGGFVAYAEPI